jgi:transmembrane sensor
MTRPHRRLADQLDFEQDAAVLEREWAAISARQQTRRGVGPRRLAVSATAIAALGAICAVGLYLWISLGPVPESGPGGIGLEGTLFSNEASTGVQHVRLPDGSSMDLEASARVRVIECAPGNFAFSLDRGRAEFDVAVIDGRRFSVVADFVEVSVKGTRFSVERSSGGSLEGVTVIVERGSVEIARTDGLAERAVITAGMLWRASRGAISTAGLVDRPQSTEAFLRSSDPRPNLPEERTGGAGSRAVGASVPEGSVGLPAPESAVPGRAATPEPSATTLFGAAEAAVRAGRDSEGASMFGAFLEEYPDDGRAGLAALELGRLRLDVLGDPKGALEALDKALAFGNRTPFSEDAASRRIEALERLGAIDSCADAREAFLVAYPASAHAASVSRRCRER